MKHFFLNAMQRRSRRVGKGEITHHQGLRTELIPGVAVRLTRSLVARSPLIVDSIQKVQLCLLHPNLIGTEEKHQGNLANAEAESWGELKEVATILHLPQHARICALHEMRGEQNPHEGLWVDNQRRRGK